MSDTETTTPNATAPKPEMDSHTQDPQPQQEETKKHLDIQFSIWPPSQRTREAVTTRLIETLSSPSVLSKRYGTMSADEATAAARRIEEEAFAAAGEGAKPEDDGIEILQTYSKEISKRMLDAVKTRAAEAQAQEEEKNHAPSAEESSASGVENEN